MLEWLTNPDYQSPSRQASRIRTPAQADRINREHAQILYGNARQETTAKIFEDLGNPTHVLLHGSSILRAGNDPGTRLLECALRSLSRNRQVILLRFSPDTKLSQYVSQLAGGRDLRFTAVDSYGDLIRGMPPTLLLHAMFPEHPETAACMLPYLTLAQETEPDLTLPELINRIMVPSDAMLRGQTISLNGEISPFFVEPAKRLQINYQLQLLREEAAAYSPAGFGGPSLHQALASGNTVTVELRANAAPLLHRLVFEEIRYIAQQRNNICLVLDQQDAGTAGLLSTMARDIPVLSVTGDLKSTMNFRQYEDFSSFLSYFDGHILCDTSQAETAQWFARYYGTCDQFLVTTDRSVNLHMHSFHTSPGLGKAVHAALLQDRARVNADRIRKFSARGEFLVSTGMRVWIYR